ncbi:MAG: MBOAT family O-acyltransferase [Faecousia sp.]
MEFNSINFIFFFLPAFLLVYYLVPAGSRNPVLTLGSLVFYAIGVRDRIWCLALLLGLIFLSWLAGLWMEHVSRRGLFLAGCLTVLFGGLLGFKYSGLFGQGIALPLGISFFTFQMAAYLIDLYRCKTQPELSLLRYSAGILLFPKLLSGPLMEPERLRLQLAHRRFGICAVDDGLRDFILGLSMKTLLADRLGGLWSQATTIGFESLSAPMAWMALLAFSLQLYFDFCGYSRMAIGLGKMLGFRLPQNFDYPYVAASMADFWRRWHITLGAWFREYLYIPLGGSRNGTARWFISSLVVWLATGIWHGSTSNFIVWGMFQFLLILLERFWMGDFLKKHRVFSHVYMILAIMLSWLLFAVRDLDQILLYLSRLVPLFGTGTAVNPRDFMIYGSQYLPYLLAGIVFSTPLLHKPWKRVRNRWLGTVICFLLFWVSVFCLSVSVNDPFLYFSF